MVSNIVDNRDTFDADDKLFTDSKDKNITTKQQHLNKLKNRTYGIYTVVAIFATATTSMYSYFSVKLANDVLNQREEESNKDYDETFLLRWIVSAIFTAREICISLLMMCKLRVRFAYFYKEYGCFLWTIVTIQGVSLLI